MKDEEIKLEEIEVSHTLGGSGRCYVGACVFIITEKVRGKESK